MLAILCSTSIALIFKYSENNHMNRYVVTSSNYLMASLISLSIISYNNMSFLSVNKLINPSIIQKILFSSDFSLTQESSIVWALFIGVPSGLFFFLAFIYYQKGVNENGAGLTGAFAKIGILVPMTISILIWNEIPTPLQWLGIILSLTSILMVNISLKDLKIDKIRVSLLLLFLFSGLAEFSNKLFQKYALIDYKLFFLFFVFFTAFLVSLIIPIIQKQEFRKHDILTGLSVGIPNLFCSFFLIMALENLKASVVFPIYTATTIVLINIGGFTIFQEHLKRKEKISVILTIIALILINI